MDYRKRRLGFLEGILSSVVNTVLFGFKVWVGAAAGSVAMMADAWHTLSDTLTSLVVILGFWISGKPGDEDHPFGHGRAELVASVVIGTLLGVVGASFLKEAYLQLRDHRSVEFGMGAIIVFGISIIAKEALARFSFWAGKKTDSQSLVADGWHHRSDALASALIIAGALFGKRWWWIDGVLGIGVSLLIFYAALSIVREAVDTLMGEKLDAKTAERLQELASSVLGPGNGIHHIHVHRYGDHQEITLHMRLSGGMELQRAHEIASAFENEIRSKLSMEATIHIEPHTEASAKA
ncbi:MAG TPA: cation diffusion facilitator family transporter [Rectinemataceae bacterium]